MEANLKWGKARVFAWSAFPLGEGVVVAVRGGRILNAAKAKCDVECLSGDAELQLSAAHVVDGSFGQRHLDWFAAACPGKLILDWHGQNRGSSKRKQRQAGHHHLHHLHSLVWFGLVERMAWRCLFVFFAFSSRHTPHNSDYLREFSPFQITEK